MITSNKIILVEGKDEVEFISALCEREQLQSYQIIEVGGVDRFKDELPIIMNHPNFDDVNSLTIIRDADKSRQSAIQSRRRYALGLPQCFCQTTGCGGCCQRAKLEQLFQC